MSQINQLLSKALSTQSEEEAIACLKMARKKNGGETFNVGGEAKSGKYTLEEWERLARKYHRVAKTIQKRAKYLQARTEYFEKRVFDLNEELREERKRWCFSKLVRSIVRFFRLP